MIEPQPPYHPGTNPSHIGVRSRPPAKIGPFNYVILAVCCALACSLGINAARAQRVVNRTARVNQQLMAQTNTLNAQFYKDQAKLRMMLTTEGRLLTAQEYGMVSPRACRLPQPPQLNGPHP